MQQKGTDCLGITLHRLDCHIVFCFILNAILLQIITLYKDVAEKSLVTLQLKKLSSPITLKQPRVFIFPVLSVGYLFYAQQTCPVVGLQKKFDQLGSVCINLNSNSSFRQSRRMSRHTCKQIQSKMRWMIQIIIGTIFMLISKLPNMSQIKYTRKFIPVSFLVKTQPLNTIMGLII